LQFVDTVSFHQVYVPVSSDAWLPFSAQVDFVFSFLGFRGNGYFLVSAATTMYSLVFRKSILTGKY